jgi:hypothetical protein
MPLPARLDVARGEAPMAGLEAELGDLRAALAGAEGGRRLALVEGAAGSGKTRLVSELAGEAHAGGAIVLLGRGSEGLAKPYLPFVEAFGDCVERLSPELLAGSPELAELSRLVPEAGELLGPSSPRGESPASKQFFLFRSALSLLRLVSSDAPLLLVLEDLHWADESTLLMLQYLLTGRGDFRGLVVATARPGAAEAPLARAVARLEREPGFSRIELGRAPGVRSPDAHPPPAGRLECLGDYWAVELGGARVTVRDGKGIRYLARLLSCPGIEIHAADLQAGAADLPAATASAAAAADLTVRGAGGEDAGAMLDESAKRAYRERIAELEADLEQAEGFNDPERAARAREELDFIARELAAAVGLGGRDRKAASQAERARVNVTRAIKGALDRIAEHDERLGGRLKASIHTGAFCRYDPPPGQEVAWEVPT